MFERELKDVGFLKRWGIVRTIRQQYVDGHSFNVAMYANDLCVWLGEAITRDEHLMTLQQALWHDVDEIFTTDLPGPNKRALVKDREHWKSTLDGWMRKTFGVLYPVRSGKAIGNQELAAKIASIVKAADNIDAAMEMACEMQLGNGNVRVHLNANLKRAEQSLRLMCRMWGVEDKVLKIQSLVVSQIHAQHQHLSEGPHISEEDLILTGLN